MRLLELAPDGDKLVAVGDFVAQVWNTDTGVVERELLGDHFGWIKAVAFAENGAKVVTCSRYRVIIWDVPTGARTTLRMESDIVGVVAVPREDRVVVYSSKKAIVLSTTSGKRLQEFGGAGEIQRMAMSAGGDLLAACSSTMVPRERQVTTIWDINSGRRLSTMWDIYSELWPFLKEPQCSVAVGTGRSPLSR